MSKVWSGRLLPAEPLAEWLRERSLAEVARSVADRHGGDAGAWRQRLERVVRGEVSHVQESTADRVATGVGMHPCTIWGRTWWTFAPGRVAPITHGTRSGYRAGCDCDPCWEAMRKAGAFYRSRRAAS